MDKQYFDQLVKGVREMKRHMAGKRVLGSRKRLSIRQTSDSSARRQTLARANSPS
jgi:hypothetical protein